MEMTKMTYEEYMQNYPEEECFGCRTSSVSYRSIEFGISDDCNIIPYCIRRFHKRCPCRKCLVKATCANACIEFLI